MKTITPKEKALAKVRAAQKKAETVSKAFGPPPVASPSGGNVATRSHAQAPAAPTLTWHGKPGEGELQTRTRAVLSPSVAAGLLVSNLTHREYETDLTTVSWYFKDGAVAAADGDLSVLKQTLAIQARTLDLIYNQFAQRAGTSNNLDHIERLLRLALKAQSQSRATVESLAMIQQGPAIFARNANINNGQQQVNNGVPAPAAPKAIDASASPALRPARARGEKRKAANQTIGVPK